MVTHRKPHKRLLDWPKFIICGDDIDGFIPVCKVRDWKHIQEIFTNDPLFKLQDDFLFRGQRRANWGLTPSLARLSENGNIDKQIADKQLDQFKFSVRGRVKGIANLNDIDVWAIGQHFGLMTPLLDWSRSPFVAMFFACEEADSEKESPKNYSRSIFALNKTKLEGLGVDVFVDSLNSEHDRLISQSGLFTVSPINREETLEAYILNELSDKEVDIDDPKVLSEYLFKIHIPMELEEERLDCFKSLRRMNIHHASLYPDLIGSSLHCNQTVRESYTTLATER